MKAHIFMCVSSDILFSFFPARISSIGTSIGRGRTASCHSCRLAWRAEFVRAVNASPLNNTLIFFLFVQDLIVLPSRYLEI